MVLVASTLSTAVRFPSEESVYAYLDYISFTSFDNK